MSEHKFKFMDAPSGGGMDMPEKKKASNMMYTIITLVILGLIFALFTNENVVNDAQDSVINKVVEDQLGDQLQVTGTKYDAANGIYDPKVLSELAEMEAQRMVKDGDITEYQRAINSNPMLKNIIGK